MVGRDLQYIRLNGTIVGALAGLDLHDLAAAAIARVVSRRRTRRPLF